MIEEGDVEIMGKNKYQHLEEAEVQRDIPRKMKIWAKRNLKGQVVLLKRLYRINQVLQRKRSQFQGQVVLLRLKKRFQQNLGEKKRLKVLQKRVNLRNQNQVIHLLLKERLQLKEEKQSNNQHHLRGNNLHPLLLELKVFSDDMILSHCLENPVWVMQSEEAFTALIWACIDHLFV